MKLILESNDQPYPGSIGQVPSRLRIVDDFLCQPHTKSHHKSSFHLAYVQLGIHAKNVNRAIVKEIKLKLFQLYVTTKYRGKVKRSCT